MKSAGKISSGSNQLWWVVTLLSVAVILPTICLLWFTTQAVRNERLAVKQKLTNVYEQRLEKLSSVSERYEKATHRFHVPPHDVQIETPIHLLTQKGSCVLDRYIFPEISTD